jgi:hypothetical protein
VGVALLAGLASDDDTETFCNSFWPMRRLQSEPIIARRESSIIFTAAAIPTIEFNYEPLVAGIARDLNTICGCRPRDEELLMPGLSQKYVELIYTRWKGIS